MSRDPRYQKLLNSKRWKELRVWKLAQTQGYCEICYREGWRGIDALAVDIHHIVPVESVIDQGEEAMKRVCFNPANLMALCVRHHVEIHQQAGSHTKEAVNERKQKKRIGFLQRNDPNYKEKDNQETMQENKRLGIFSTLNYEKLKDMTMDERKLAVTNHAKDVLTRKTKDGKGPQIPDDDYDLYDVTAEYTIMDCRYNKQGKILATFKAQRTDEDLTIELVSFESVTS